MSKKWDEKNLNGPDISTMTGSVSGSNSTVEQSELQTPPPAGEAPEKGASLIVPIEEYTKMFTKTQRAAVREYRLSKFPNLFDIRGLTDDRVSEHPDLYMSEPAKLYTALIEEGARSITKKTKEKKLH